MDMILKPLKNDFGKFHPKLDLPMHMAILLYDNISWKKRPLVIGCGRFGMYLKVALSL